MTFISLSSSVFKWKNCELFSTHKIIIFLNKWITLWVCLTDSPLQFIYCWGIPHRYEYSRDVTSYLLQLLLGRPSVWSTGLLRWLFSLYSSVWQINFDAWWESRGNKRVLLLMRNLGLLLFSYLIEIYICNKVLFLLHTKIKNYFKKLCISLFSAAQKSFIKS